MPQHFTTIGIMPQKTYIFWILIYMVFFIAAVNFIILVIMMNVLRIGLGLESIEIVSAEKLIKFYGNADFDYIVYKNGKLKGFNNHPIEINGIEESVIMSVQNNDDITKLNNMILTENEISFNNVKIFDVIDPISRNNIFSTDYKDFKIPKGLPRLDVKKLRVNRLVSLQNSNLTIKSDAITRLSGNGGVRIRGKEITIIADGDIYLNSVNGSINLLADNIKIDMKHISIVPPRMKFDPVLTTQYKLCLCMPQGVLFKVPVIKNIKSHLACSFVDLSSDNNPCTK
ncbi:hypothetical protein PGB90_000354 [Kerria lacca]